MLKLLLLGILLTGGAAEDGFGDIPEPCRDVELSQMCSMCERIEHRRCLSGQHFYHHDYLKYLAKDLDVPCEGESKDEHALEEYLAASNRTANYEYLEPYYQKLYDRFARPDEHGCETSQEKPCSRVAILLTGHPRTMFESEMVSQYASVLESLKRRTSFMHIFAYLDISGTPWHRVALRQYHGVKAHEAAIKQWKPLARAEVEKVLDAWGIPYTLAEHQDNPTADSESARLHPNISAEPGCAKLLAAPKKTGVQFAKVSAATRMMLRAEEESGEEFHSVVRLRPDMCINSLTKFLHFTLKVTRRDTFYSFTMWDHTAVYPRWMAHLYASAWRSYGGHHRCNPDPDWENAEFDTAGTCAASPSERPYCLIDNGIYNIMKGFGARVVDMQCMYGWAQGRRLTGCFDLK